MNAYIPMDRRLALAHGETLPTHATGAVLFADISGFTLLTDTLMRELGRKQGAEEITRHLNEIYTALIACAHRYRGSVILFSGDAITCWFNDTPEPAPIAHAIPLSSSSFIPHPSSFHAVAAALDMQAEMANFAAVHTPGGQHIPFAIRVGVVAGSVRRFIVGDPGQQRLDILAGALLAYLTRAGRCARSGELLVGSEVVAHLGTAALISHWREDDAGRFAVIERLTKPVAPNPWPAVPPLPPDVVEPWLPPSLHRRIQIQSQQAQFLAELRPAAALLLKFDDLDYDHSPNAGDHLDAYVRWVQCLAARYEGVLIDLIMGDKGSYLYLCFGVLVAHDDDAGRAVAAALDLQNPPAELDFARRPQIGLAWGQLRTGAYGGPQRLTYGALGNPVNLAARLMMQAPPGEIWCDGELYQAARRQWQFAVLPAVPVKGRADPVAVYRPAGRQRAARQMTGLPKIVGRQHEVTQLVAALDDLGHGVNRIVLIEGEGGIGKSTLVQKLLALVQERSLTAYMGAGQSIEQHTPYRAWRDILNTFFGVEGVTDTAERQQRLLTLSQTLAPQEVSRLPLFNEIMNLALPETERTAALEPALRQQSLATLVTNLLQVAARRQHLILVLEDAHWLDSLSWELTVQVARGLFAAGVPLLMVLALRPLDPHSLPGQQAAILRRFASTWTIPLSLLQPQEIAALISDRLALAEDGMPPELAEFISRRAEGNPFFAEELLLALREQAVITLQPAGNLNHCLITGDLAAAAQRLPDTLQGVILARVDRLPPERQLLLKVAAVIGRTFTYDLLHHILNQYQPVSTATLDEHLDALLQQDLAYPDLPAPDSTYIFKHIITQEVAYQTLLFAQRRQLHRLVAEWYEQQAGTAIHLPLLVYHYHRAADPQRERHYAQLAADQAISQYAQAEAITYLTRLLALTPKSEAAQRFDLLLRREAAYEMQGNQPAQAADLDELEQISLLLADSQRQSEVALRRGRRAESIGDYATAIAHSQTAIALAQVAGSASRLAQGHYQWGVALMRQSQYEAAHDRLQTALTHARAAALPQVQAHCLRSLGVVYAYQGHYAIGRPYYEQAFTIYQQIGDRRGESRALSNLGSAARYLGDIPAGMDFAYRSLAISQEIGERKWEGTALNNLGLDWLDLGDLAMAESYFQQALQIGREVGSASLTMLAMANLSGLLTRQGHHESALDYGRQALHLAQEMSAPQDAAVAWQAIGDVYLDTSRPAEAAEAFSQAIQLRQAVGQGAAEIESRAGLAAAHLAQAENSAAIQQVEIILPYLGRPDFSGAEEPFLVYLRCYQVLAALNDGRAAPLLAEATQLLHAHATRISDERLRHSFLENIPTHRQLLTLHTHTQIL